MYTTTNPLVRFSALKSVKILRSRLASCRQALWRRVARAGTPLIVACCTAIVVLGRPVLAFAQEDAEGREGRLEGYTVQVAVERGGTGLTWIAFFFLAMIGVSALFKSAKRTHLD
jgi:hypothetical protein